MLVSAGRYLEDVANLEEAEKILGKAIEVLTKYYDYLEAMKPCGRADGLILIGELILQSGCDVLYDVNMLHAWVSARLPSEEQRNLETSDLRPALYRHLLLCEHDAG